MTEESETEEKKTTGADYVKNSVTAMRDMTEKTILAVKDLHADAEASADNHDAAQQIVEDLLVLGQFFDGMGRPSIRTCMNAGIIIISSKKIFEDEWRDTLVSCLTAIHEYFTYLQSEGQDLFTSLGALIDSSEKILEADGTKTLAEIDLHAASAQMLGEMILSKITDMGK